MNQEPLPCARDFLETHVHTVTAKTPLPDVVRFLLKHEVSNTPVVEETPNGRQRLLGFLSERDCLEYLSNEMFFGSPAQPQTAETMMTRHPVCVTPDTDIFALTSVFIAHNFRHLPVVDGDEFIGIVSRRDVLLALDRYYRELLAAGEARRHLGDYGQLASMRFLVRGE